MLQTGGPTSDTLKMVKILTISDEECDEILTGYVKPSNICAGVPGGGKGHCSVSKSRAKNELWKTVLRRTTSKRFRCSISTSITVQFGKSYNKANSYGAKNCGLIPRERRALLFITLAL